MGTAIIWKESVYKNGFKCSHCGTKLYDEKNNKVLDTTGVDLGNPDHLHCMKCKTLVAFTKPYDIKDGMEHLQGKWKGEI